MGKFGRDSVLGSYLKNHILFKANDTQYFAQKIYELAEDTDKFDDNHLEILNIFLSRFETLHDIKMKFNNMNEETLRAFLKKNNEKNKVATYFLVKILDNAKAGNTDDSENNDEQKKLMKKAEKLMDNDSDVDTLNDEKNQLLKILE